MCVGVLPAYMSVIHLRVQHPQKPEEGNMLSGIMITWMLAAMWSPGIKPLFSVRAASASDCKPSLFFK